MKTGDIYKTSTGVIIVFSTNKPDHWHIVYPKSGNSWKYNHNTALHLLGVQGYEYVGNIHEELRELGRSILQENLK